jgi:hypothetical protein
VNEFGPNTSIVYRQAANAAIVNLSVATSARIWNYLIGGRDYYDIDKTAAEIAAKVYPDLKRMAVRARQFHDRVVRHLVEQGGVRQFLDIGAGYPVGGPLRGLGRRRVRMQDTHEIAQDLASDARVAYVDNDPIVLAHARALLRSATAEGHTAVICGDFAEPDHIVQAAEKVLDFEAPVAVMFLQVLGHAPTFADARRSVDTIMAAVPDGSYLVIADITSDGADDVVPEARAAMAEAEFAATGAAPYTARTCGVLRDLLDGLDLIEPGLVSVNNWRPSVTLGPRRALPFYGAVARKPGRTPVVREQ